MDCIVQIGSYPESPSCIRGGVEASIYGLAQEQSRLSKVHVFDWPRIKGNQKVEKDGEVTVHRYCNKGSRQLSMVRLVDDVVHEIDMLNPDVCHVHGTTLFSWRIYQQLRKKGRKVILTIHGLICVEKRNLLKKRFSLKGLFQYVYQGAVERRFLSHVPVAIVDTEYVKNMVLQYPIRQKPKMVVIPQGINEVYYSLHCTSNSSKFLSVGAIGERKGHLLTIQAFEMLRQEGVEAKLIIAGTVADRQYFDRLCWVARHSKYKEDILVLPDLTFDDLLQLYQQAQVFVLHSQEESQGIVFAEAMATGMPVVSTKVGGVPFVVKDGETGLLSDYGDVSKFAGNMKKLLKETNLWQSMSAKAIQLASDYHWTHISESILGLYQ